MFRRLFCVTTIKSAIIISSLLAVGHFSLVASPVVILEPIDQTGLQRNHDRDNPSIKSLPQSSSLHFTENRGQIVDSDANPRPDIRYVADAPGVKLYIRSTGISYVFIKRTTIAGDEDDSNNNPDQRGFATWDEVDKQDRSSEVYRLDMELVGSNPFARIRPEKELPNVTNYYLPHCPDGILNVPSFEGLVYEDVYPSIDMVIKTIDGRIKSEFIVHPGGDPANIRLRYSGAESCDLLATGGILIGAPIGFFQESKPESWLDNGRAVRTEFETKNSTVSFQLENYDLKRTLIIDPWATFHGGSDHDLFCAVDTDNAGNVYASGFTRSTNFPVKSGIQMALEGVEDIIIVKYSSAGSLLWSTYFGGSLDDRGGAIEIDPSGNPIFTGWSESSNFPVQNAWQSAYGGGGDAILVKMTSAGTRVWATFFGGSAGDGTESNQFMRRAGDLSLDPDGNIYIHHDCHSQDLPVLRAQQPTFGGTRDAFLAKFTNSGNLCWATYLGGSELESSGGCAATSVFTVAVCGPTGSSDFPMLHPLQSLFQGNPTNTGPHAFDGYITEYDSSGTMLWSSYISGNGTEHYCALDSDNEGALYAAMECYSSDLPIKNPIMSTPPDMNDQADIYLCKYAATPNPANGRTIEWATYYGGAKHDGISTGSISVDGSGTLALAGWTWSSNYPTQNSTQNALAGECDMYLTIISGQLVVQSSTYCGGTKRDVARAVEFDASGNIVVAGYTWGADFPIENAMQPSYGGGLLDAVLFSSASNISPPADPTGLTASAQSPTRIQLDWKDNANNETGYIVEIQNGTSAWSVADTVPANAKFHVANNLQPETTYNFRVKAVNSQYESVYSNPASATTPAFLPPANLEATATSSDAVFLRWIDNSDNEDGFVIECKDAGSSWVVCDTVLRDISMLVVTGLTPATTYSFRVRAFEGAVPSGYSNVADATTLLFLDSPTNLTADVLSETEVYLEWEDNSSQESAYEIEQRLGWDVVTITTQQDVTSYNATGLLPDTVYSFRVRAVAPGAASSWSNEVTVTTHIIPKAPVNLLATALDFKTIHLAWQRGSSNEDSFEIERKEEGGSWAMAHTTGPGETELTDLDLNPETIYWYRIRALNDLGPSAWSNEDSAMTYSVPVPNTPFSLKASATGSISIELTWIMSYPSSEDGFEIEESLTGDEGDFVKVVPDAAAGAKSYIRSGLVAKTKYYYRIRAYNTSGASAYTSIVSATTLEQGQGVPAVPSSVTAYEVSDTEIRISWSMPVPTVAIGFELEQSLTANENDFVRLDPDPEAETRTYYSSGLNPGTTYYYRLRGYNQYGKSAWSDIVSATTKTVSMSKELKLAITGKEGLFPGMEAILPDGDARMQTLRSLLGDYPRGYDESPAQSLIESWRREAVENQELATDAMNRFALFEQIMHDCIGDGQASSSMPGARFLAYQLGKAPALCVKGLGALGLSWQEERDYLGEENAYLDKALEDLSLAAFDGANTLLMLTGANTDDGVSSFYSDVITQKGEMENLTSTLLLGLLDYYEESMLAKLYLPATQPLIATFADRTEQMDIAGVYDSALARYASYLAKVRTETGAFDGTFNEYNAICTGLDVAFLIQQASGKDLPVYLKALMPVKERMIDRMWKAVTHAEIPITRSLYLTASPIIPEIGSLPADLLNAGNSIFDPTLSGFRRSGGGTLSKRTNVLDAFINSEVIDDDRDLLLDLRTKILASDTAYISAEYDDIRLSGSRVYSELDCQLRPLFGIPSASLYPDADLRGDYYRTIGYAHRAKTRRTVLSLSLAAYRLEPTVQKQTDLVAEIDTILGYIPEAIIRITDISTRTQSLIIRPVLALDDAWLNADPAGGPVRYSFRFNVKNVGGAETSSSDLKVSVLTADVIPVGTGEYQAGALDAGSLFTDSMAVDIPQDVKAVTFSIAMSIEGGQTFVDQITFPVPRMPTEIIDVPPVARSIELYQNYPNPFNPTTTISYSLPERMEVSLVVIDPLGREVQRLFTGQEHDSGRHTVQFDAGDLSSGIYFYRLTTPDKRITRKMLLVH